MDLTEYAEALPARLQPFGPVSLRRMFGGYGVFYQGLMVGLVAGDGLYLKTDARSAPLFIKAGCRQFVYYRGHRPVAMSYYRAPDDLFSSEESVRAWLSEAYEAALRAHSRRRRTSHKPRPPSWGPRTPRQR